MSRSIKLLAITGILVAVAACARKQEEVVIVEPVSSEPVFTGKYK